MRDLDWRKTPPHSTTLTQWVVEAGDLTANTELEAAVMWSLSVVLTPLFCGLPGKPSLLAVVRYDCFQNGQAVIVCVSEDNIQEKFQEGL